MFIDTWNRDEMNISGGSKFVAGPLPRHSLAPAGAAYSGLLECPLTDRIQKLLPGGNQGFNSTFSKEVFQCSRKNSSRPNRCAHAVATAGACFRAAQAAVGNVSLAVGQGASDSMAAGCTIAYGGAGEAPAGARAFFNTAATSVCCGAGVEALEGSTQSLVGVGMHLRNDTTTITLVGPAGVWFGVGRRSHIIVVECGG